MLRLINYFNAKVKVPLQVARCFTTEPQATVEDFDREKKIKIFELEMEASFSFLKIFSLSITILYHILVFAAGGSKST